jgi:hypothetical protein
MLYTIDAEQRLSSRGDTFYFPGATEQEAEAAFRLDIPGYDIVTIRLSTCINGPWECEGEIEAYAFGRNGKAFPRCRKHADERREKEEELNRDYPDSPFAPAWFDETAIGERWNDDY